MVIFLEEFNFSLVLISYIDKPYTLCLKDSLTLEFALLTARSCLADQCCHALFVPMKKWHASFRV